MKHASLNVVMVATLFLATACAGSATQGGARVVPTPAPPTGQAAPAPATPAAPAPPAPGGALGDLDRLFLESYRARRDAWKAPGPIVLVRGSSLLLYRDGAPATERVIPDVYHALKAVAHLPFGLYLRLAPEANGQPLTQSVRSVLPDFVKRIDAARAVVSGFGLSPAQVARQHTLLDRVRTLVTGVLESHAIDPATLRSFAAAVGPLMLANADEAGCAQIRGTHTQMMKWKAAMSADEWSRLVVVSQSGHQARYRNAGTQYFAWLLDEKGPAWALPGESMRVLYAETLRTGETPLLLAATIDIDAGASRDFFGDAWRLSEDILSEGAARCVNELAAAAAADTISRPLTDLNNGFRRAYADARGRMLAAADPVIVAGNETAVLLTGGRRTEASVNVPLYDSLKTIAHIPLAIYVALTPGDGALDAERIKTVEGLRALIPPARAALSTLGLPAPLLARQETIVSESLAFLDEGLAARAFSADRLRAFVRRLVPPIIANMDDATRAQLEALHAQVSAWRREMGPAAWDRLHVVVVGAHMPRDGAVTMQYFSRLLNEPVEGRRIVYAESLWEEPRALELLGTHLLDGRVGDAFFGEFMRMHRDLLADVGREYLLKLLPQ